MSATRQEVWTGMTVKVKARGPFILPLTSGSTGPFPFVDFELEGGGGFRRFTVADNGQVSAAVGTGNFSVLYLDITKPDQSVARLRFLANGQFTLAVGVLEGARTHVDITSANGSVWRLTVQDNGQTQITKQ